MSDGMSQYRMLGFTPRKTPKPVILTGSQARVARGVLGWTQDELAKRAKVSVADVREIEADRTVPAPVLTRVRQAFEGARIAINESAAPRLRA